MANDKEKDVLTTQDAPKEDEGITKEVGAEIVNEDEVNDGNVVDETNDEELNLPPDEDAVKEGESVMGSVGTVEKVSLEELTVFVKYLIAKMLSPAELEIAKQSFPKIFKD